MNRDKWTAERMAMMTERYHGGENRWTLLDDLNALPGAPLLVNDIGSYVRKTGLKVDPEARKRQQAKAGKLGAAAYIAMRQGVHASHTMTPAIVTVMDVAPPRPVALAFTRDGGVSIAKLVEARADRDNEETPATPRDAISWGRHNGAKSDALSDINARREEFKLPSFTLVPERRAERPLPQSKPDRFASRRAS